MPTSPYPPLDIPNLDLWTFLFERKRPFPDDKVIFRDAESNRHYTFGGVQTAALEFGKGLRSLFDWQKGDMLALFTPNSIDTPAVMCGTLWAGGVVTPANPAYTVDELAFQLKASEAKALVTQTALLHVALEAAHKVGIPEDRVILIGDERAPNPTRVRHFSSIRNTSGATRYVKVRVTEPREEMAFLVFSSGTTGLPKGVMLSHANIVANILQHAAGEAGRLTWAEDRVLAFLPFFHIYGLTVLVHKALYTGYELVVMSSFSIEKWCAIVQSHRITFAYIVPPVALQLSKHPAVGKYDLTSLRMMNSGAAPLTADLVEAVYARIHVGLKQGYGLSETSPTTHTQGWDEWRSHIGSVGKLLPNQEIKFVATDGSEESEGQELPVGKAGEIYLKGPNVFMGYFKNPAATESALSRDGWFRTGDVGYQDEEGNLYITDRVKELIKYKGFQVAPAELEGVLVENEAVDDVAVIGVESKEHGTEVPLAFIVRSAKSKRSGVTENEEAGRIVRWLDGRVARYKRLRGGVRFVDSIPKSASGKILRRVLRHIEQTTVKSKL
ncbi:putative phenylacetyl-CoA ligase [Aspergillus steynii IBT 23096]|uniref:Putative phenylacetyl-CoA ligase n=1 Tax=Aspergillus steynii IBT 23096 TaxID=1392250 RepID=A0A2I2G628_9EURO|nr:putative phenylacetyl-CoA ligase [Aspergillus steynii IBT 23096]PLB48325.1 putative phenylacetyl-CoA ligase [Aspergillus steynii IBT 23096]